MSKIYKSSKAIHKWTSIIIALLMLYMGISGILLNHPELIGPVSVSSSFIPDNYRVENWNRSSISQLKFSKFNPSISIIGGYEGVYISKDAGKNYKKMPQNGLPNSQYYNKTKTVYILENESGIKGALAGTFGGLYYFDFAKNFWNKVNLEDKHHKIVKIIDYKDKIAVFSASGASLINPNNLQDIQNINLTKNEKETKLTLIEFFFQLHTGEIWGLPGKLLFDIAGIILIFLTISGLYIWLSPKTSKFRIKLSDKASKTKWSIYKFFFKYHLKLGIYAAAVLLIIGVTGFFMRPPGIAAIMNGDIAVSSIPLVKMDNPWQERIRNAMYDKVSDRVIIDAKDGFWVSDNGIEAEYTQTAPPVPIFAMGATVLEQDTNGDYLIGSFAGLFRVSPESGHSIDAMTGKAPYNVSLVRPGSNLITSYFKTPIGEEFVTTHFEGIIPVNTPFGMGSRFQVTEGTMNDFSMSLWNYLFEVHNGRIFEFAVGDFYILIAPLISLIFLISLITGIFDWAYLKIKKIKMDRYDKKEKELLNKDKLLIENEELLEV